jgi:hypothetical protein
VQRLQHRGREGGRGFSKTARNTEDRISEQDICEQDTRWGLFVVAYRGFVRSLQIMKTSNLLWNLDVSPNYEEMGSIFGRMPHLAVDA